jgi:hypothetical protein
MHLLRVAGFALAITSVAAIAVPEVDSGPSLANFSAHSANITGIDELPLDWPSPETAADKNDEQWDQAVERGAKLLRGMKSSDAEAAVSYNTGDTVESPFDGDGVAAFREWGYSDNPLEYQEHVNIECDMDSVGGHKLKKAFRDLGLGTRSKNDKGQTNASHSSTTTVRQSNATTEVNSPRSQSSATRSAAKSTASQAPSTRSA